MINRKPGDGTRSQLRPPVAMGKQILIIISSSNRRQSEGFCGLLDFSVSLSRVHAQIQTSKKSAKKVSDNVGDFFRGVVLDNSCSVKKTHTLAERVPLCERLLHKPAIKTHCRTKNVTTKELAAETFFPRRNLSCSHIANHPAVHPLVAHEDFFVWKDHRSAFSFGKTSPNKSSLFSVKTTINQRNYFPRQLTMFFKSFRSGRFCPAPHLPPPCPLQSP